MTKTLLALPKAPAIVTDKLRLVNAIDDAAAGRRESRYTIDVILAKSPEKEVKCGGVVVYETHRLDEDLMSLDDARAAEARERIQAETSNWAEVKSEGPHCVRDEVGSGTAWLSALETTLRQLFQKYGGNADIKVKCPKLRITQTFRRADVEDALKTKIPSLFRQIDQLLTHDFQYDPWLAGNRRGAATAESASRAPKAAPKAKSTKERSKLILPGARGRR